MSALRSGPSGFGGLTSLQQIESIVANRTTDESSVENASAVLGSVLPGASPVARDQLARIVGLPLAGSRAFQIQAARAQVSEWALVNPAYAVQAQEVLNAIKKGIDSGSTESSALMSERERYIFARAQAGKEQTAARRRFQKEVKEEEARISAAAGSGQGAPALKQRGVPREVERQQPRGSALALRTEAVEADEFEQANAGRMESVSRASATMSGFVAPLPRYQGTFDSPLADRPLYFRKLTSYFDSLASRSQSDIVRVARTPAMQEFVNNTFAELNLFWQRNLPTEYGLLQQAVVAAQSTFQGRLANIDEVSPLQMEDARRTANEIFRTAVSLYAQDVQASRSLLERSANGIVFMLIAAVVMMVQNGVALEAAYLIAFMFAIFLLASVFGFSDAAKKQILLRQFLSTRLSRSNVRFEEKVSAANVFEFSPDVVESDGGGPAALASAAGSVLSAASSVLSGASSAAASVVNAASSAAGSALGASASALRGESFAAAADSAAPAVQQGSLGALRPTGAGGVLSASEEDARARAEFEAFYTRK